VHRETEQFFPKVSRCQWHLSVPRSASYHASVTPQ
jgi:hypothetical protein